MTILLNPAVLFNISEESFGEDFWNADREQKYPDFISNNSKYINVYFTMQKLKNVLQHFKNYSPSKNKNFAGMVKQLPSNAQQVILKVFNATWEAGVLPLSWKTTVIIPIAKLCKDPKSITSYRPIA